MKQLKLHWHSALTLFFLVLVIACLFDSLQLGRVAAWIPRATLTTTLLLLVMQLLQELHRAPSLPEPAAHSKASREQGSEGSAGRRQTALAILRISFLAPSIWLFGMSAGAAAFCLVYLRWQADESWKFSLVFSIILGLLIQVIFTGLLRITLYPGVITQILA